MSGGGLLISFIHVTRDTLNDSNHSKNIDLFKRTISKFVNRRGTYSKNKSKKKINMDHQRTNYFPNGTASSTVANPFDEPFQEQNPFEDSFFTQQRPVKNEELGGSTADQLYPMREMIDRQQQYESQKNSRLEHGPVSRLFNDKQHVGGNTLTRSQSEYIQPVEQGPIQPPVQHNTQMYSTIATENFFDSIDEIIGQPSYPQQQIQQNHYYAQQKTQLQTPMQPQSYNQKPLQRVHSFHNTQYHQQYAPQHDDVFVHSDLQDRDWQLQMKRQFEEEERFRRESMERKNRELQEQRDRIMRDKIRQKELQEREDHELAMRLQLEEEKRQQRAKQEAEDREQERKRRERIAEEEKERRRREREQEQDEERKEKERRERAAMREKAPKRGDKGTTRLLFKITHEDHILSAIQIGVTVKMEILDGNDNVVYTVRMRVGGTTTIWDHNERPIYKITHEDGHLHNTYAIWSSRGMIGQCKERFKLSQDRKFNYKRMDNAQVLKMVGKVIIT